ncbi:MAG: WbqC family protein [Bacteroidota bacterium]
MNLPPAILLEMHYFPTIQYWCKLLQYPEVHIEQWENYKKGSYRNRCYIATANGPLRLSIPLKKGKNEQMPIREVQIAHDQSWLSQHWTSIQSAYGNAPFFEHYAADIAPLFEKKWRFLFDFNWTIVQTLCDSLGLSPAFQLTEAYQAQTQHSILDGRNLIHPKSHLSPVDPHFQAQIYPQVFVEKTGFLPNLSILDLLFCTGPQTLLLLEECIQV